MEIVKNLFQPGSGRVKSKGQKMKRLYVYKGKTPVAIQENADQMQIDDINRLSRALKLLFDRDIYLKPIHPGDFVFDPETGHKLDRIGKFVYPEFKKEGTDGTPN